jgi:hypothetical protein
VLAALRSFFSTPRRQAAGWSSLGIAGAALLAGGVFLLTAGGGDGPGRASLAASAGSPAATPSATATRTPTRAPTATATPTAAPTETPVPPTATPVRRPEVAAVEPTPAPAATAAPTEEPTPQPAATAAPTETAYTPGTAYCNTISPTAPPDSVIGLLTIGGAKAPKGTMVGLAFDGIPGPVRATPAEGGYRVDFAPAGPGSGCTNQLGAAIAVVYNGVQYPTGHTVGDSAGVPVRLDLELP